MTKRVAMRARRAILAGLVALAVGCAATACSSGSGSGLGSGTTAQSGDTASASTDAASGGVTAGVFGTEYKHGVALISIDDITASDETPSEGKAVFDITGLQLSAGSDPLTFTFVVACDGDPVGSLVPNTAEFASHDGKTIHVQALAGGGATDTYVEVPSDCTDATVTISAPGLGPIRYDVPADALTAG